MHFSRMKSLRLVSMVLKGKSMERQQGLMSTSFVWEQI